jgi:hypothetical protein
MFLRSQRKGVYVDSLIRGAGVDLVRLDPREVRPLAFREAVLAVKLELSDDDRVLAPAVHVQRRLSENECSRIGDCGTIVVVLLEVLFCLSSGPPL